MCRNKIYTLFQTYCCVYLLTVTSIVSKLTPPTDKGGGETSKQIRKVNIVQKKECIIPKMIYLPPTACRKKNITWLGNLFLFYLLALFAFSCGIRLRIGSDGAFRGRKGAAPLRCRRSCFSVLFQSFGFHQRHPMGDLFLPLGLKGLRAISLSIYREQWWAFIC